MSVRAWMTFVALLCVSVSANADFTTWGPLLQTRDFASNDPFVNSTLINSNVDTSAPGVTATSAVYSLSLNPSLYAYAYQFEVGAGQSLTNLQLLFAPEFELATPSVDLDTTYSASQDGTREGFRIRHRAGGSSFIGGLFTLSDSDNFGGLPTATDGVGVVDWGLTLSSNERSVVFLFFSDSSNTPVLSTLTADDNSGAINLTVLAPVPEPASALLFAGGFVLGGIALRWARRPRKTA